MSFWKPLDSGRERRKRRAKEEDRGSKEAEEGKVRMRRGEGDKDRYLFFPFILLSILIHEGFLRK